MAANFSGSFLGVGTILQPEKKINIKIGIAEININTFLRDLRSENLKTNYFKPPNN